MNLEVAPIDRSTLFAEPPKSLWQALRKIGPGIILAGGIVGSGELILTTSFGAQYGYTFLWLILFSCVIKVFVQIELGRYAISSGKPTLTALDELPGPRAGAHWLVWWWAFMFLGSISQLGAMTGGTGQSLNLAFPGVAASISSGLSEVAPALSQRLVERPEDCWAFFVCLATVLLLWSGSYRQIERLTTALVLGITLLTTVCVLALPATNYPIHFGELLEGLKFAAPAAGVAIGFSVFGITGVGASELYSYPYWCIEKGYARFAGPRDDSEEWARRARGWVRVMYLDAWVSMVVFTVATVAFYLMGAAVLHPQGLNPKGQQLILTLSQMYIGPFGLWTQVVFLVGAGAVLFKTLYVSSASNSRLISDLLGLSHIVRYRDDDDRKVVIRSLCMLLPVVALVLYLVFGEPQTMVMIGGLAQAVTLPVISGAAVYLRFRRTDRRLAPSALSDALFLLAVLLISYIAVYAVIVKLTG